MSKVKKTVLIVSGSVLLVAVCVISLYFYAKNEINKEKFIPPENDIEVKAELKTVPSEILTYTEGLYNAAFTDETSVTKTVTIDIPDDSIKASPFSDDDYQVLLFAKGQYVNFLDSEYSEFENIKGNKVENIRPIEFDAADINGDCTMTDGATLETGEDTDKDFYFFSADVNGLEYPVEDKTLYKQYATFAIGENLHIIDDFKKEIADMGEVTDEHIELISGNISGKINKYRNQLTSIDITHTYTCYYTFQFENEYEKLGAVEFSFNYVVTEHYDFNWYGAYLTSNYMYLNPDDEEAIPLDVNVGDEKYKITFKSSDESKITVSEDGLVTAVAVTDDGKPAEISYSLEINGHKYSGVCYVIVTSLEISETEEE